MQRSTWEKQALRAAGRVTGMEIQIGSVGQAFEFISMGDSNTGKSGQTEDSIQADIANILVCHIIF